MAISAEELDDLARRGFIAGPEEDEESFLLRIEISPTAKGNTLPQELHDRCKRQWGFSLPWASVQKSSRLAWWHAGVMEYWEGRPRIEVSRLVWNHNFPVCREELLIHEWFHVARAGFDEPRFEEVIAYRSSRSWRCWLSPLFQASWEGVAFLLLCLAGPLFVLSGWEFFFFPIGAYSLWLVSRLTVKQWLLDRCLSRLPIDEPLHLAAFLTDTEIVRMTPGMLKLKSRAPDSLRWRQIVARFPELLNDKYK